MNHQTHPFMNHESSTPWSFPKRLAFRFLFSVVMLSILEPFGLFGQMIGLAKIAAPWDRLVKWVGQQVFHVTITVMPNGSGDTTFNYVEVFCWVVLAISITLVWSVLDRRKDYARLSDALRLVVRGYLALAMLSYGMNKLVPLQFGSLRLAEMVQPIGEQSPMGLLWRFMASSPAYTMFTGFAEVLSAYLLMFRRTTMLGALLCAGVMAHVVALNFCYDVPVKLFSCRLFLLSLLLLAPDLKRLWRFFILNEAIEPRVFPPRLHSGKTRVVARTLKVVVLVLYPVMVLLNTSPMWLLKLTSAPRNPLHGIWIVDEFKRDNQVLPPLTTDKQRWNHLIIEGVHFPGIDASTIGVITPMSDPSDRRWQKCAIDEARHTLNLTPFDKKKDRSAALTFTQPKPDQLVLAGTCDGKPMEAKLHRIPDAKLPLLSRGFHWINEYPFSN
jgi:hypothetical protein